MSDAKLILEKLDQIISLLQSLQSNNIHISIDDNEPKCNCGEHLNYNGTGGWHCPVHGHKFSSY